MMRILNCLLGGVTAVLLFFTSYEDFDQGYIQSKYFPFYAVHQNTAFTRFDIGLTTETYKHSNQQFQKDILDLYKAIPYDGYIFYREATHANDNHLRPHVIFYLKNTTNMALSHVALSADITAMPATITNDLTDKDAEVLVLPFKKFDTGLRTDFAKEKIVYKPIDSFQLAPTSSKDMILSLNFIIPTAEVSEFFNQFKASFIDRNYDCSTTNSLIDNQVCNMFYSTSRREAIYISQKMNFNFWATLISLGAIMIVLSGLASCLVMMNRAFKNSKEIAARRLHGNKPSRIYLRIFVAIGCESLGSFASVLIVLALSFLNFSLALTHRYLMVLLTIALSYTLLMILFFFIFTLILTYFSHGRAFKRTLNPGLMFQNGILLKSLVLIGLIQPLQARVLSFNDHQSYLNHHAHYPHLNEGYSVSLNYGYAMDHNQQSETDIWLFNLVELGQHDFISPIDLSQYFDHLVHSKSRLLTLALNRSALAHYDIVDSLGQRVNVAALSTNTLLIPDNEKQAYERFGFSGNAHPIFVTKTPTFFQKLSGSAPIISPALLVLVDDPRAWVSGINFNAIRLRDDPQAIALFDETVQQKLSTPEFVESADFYHLAHDATTKRVHEIWLVSGGFIAIAFLLTSLISEMFVAKAGQAIAVHYLLGQSRGQRFRHLYVACTIITSSIIVTIVFKNHLENEGSSSFVMMVAGFLIITDTLSTALASKHFDWHDLLNRLNGAR